MNRLREAHGPWGATSWTYDAAGNRRREYSPGLTEYFYDATTQRLTSTVGTVNEAFTYDVLGRLKSDSRGTYNYTPGGMLQTVTAPNVSASYAYDAEAARVQRTVNSVTTYSIRAAGGQVLSEYQAACGSVVWSRDIIYAGARALGAAKAPSNQPTIAFTAATNSVNEAAGVATLTVRVTTPSAGTLTCPATVSYRAVSYRGEASLGGDFTGVNGTLTFPSGTASGATRTITVPLVNDATDEADERFAVELAEVAGATLGVSSHLVTIVDDDPPPTISIGNVTVNEAAGQALFTLTLSAASARQIEVNYVTASESAWETADFLPTAGRLIFLAGETQKQVPVSLLNDDHAEQNETFVLQLSSPLNATLAQTFGRATIVDNETPRVPIDPSLPGTYFPDLTTTATTSTYLPIVNPHAVPVTARVTFTRPNGTGIARDFIVPAQRRITVDLAVEPQIAGNGDVSAVVQSLDVSRPLVAESTSYWEADWRGGRSTRGVTTPKPFWYFAEGATNVFDEYFTIYNPSNHAIFAELTLYPTGAPSQMYTYLVPSGPGRIKVHVNTLAPSLEHGTGVAGKTLDGNASPIVVERTMYWFNGDRRDGHSVNGVDTFTGNAYFAEGAVGAFSQFLTLANPFAQTANVAIYYLDELGNEHPQNTTVPPFGRVTLPPPAGLSGSFAIHVASMNDVAIAAERVMYGSGFVSGDAEIGSSTTSTTWQFAEGAANSYFRTFVLLGNPTYTAAAVTLTFRLDTGAIVTHAVTVPARGRTTVDLDSIPALSGRTFGIDVTATNGVPIVAERKMFWPSSWQGSHVSLGRPW